MKFFIPNTPDEKAQEELYRLIKNNIEGFKRAVSDRRIRQVDFFSAGKRDKAEVGRPDPIYGDDVYAILLSADGREIYICTPSRGMFNDQPITIATTDVSAIVDFEP